MPVEKDIYVDGALSDKKEAYRRIRKQLLKDKAMHLVRVVRLEQRTETLAMPVEKFISLCMEDKTSNV